MTGLGILHLTTFLQGGAGRAIADLACAQHAAGHRVTVVTSETGSGEFGNYPEYLGRLRAAGVTVHACDSLFARDAGLNMRVVETLRRDVAVNGIDVVHAHAAVPAFIGMTFVRDAERSIPVIQTQHGWGINKTAQQAAFDIQVLRDVTAVVTTSRATARLLVDLGVPKSSIEIIPCGVATETTAAPAHAGAALAPLRDRGLRVAACIGSVTANKNQRLVVEALAQLGDVPVGAAFIGEGSDTLLDAARALGVESRIVSCGYQHAAAAWLPLADMLIVPSKTEGQGLVVLEAFRAGVPVLASRIPALQELVEQGTSGMLFDCGDARSLAEGIRAMLELPATGRDALAVGGRQRLEGEFSIDRMVQRHETLYRRAQQSRLEATPRIGSA
jgi:glycosyltransferase involved in cell wall biosynthesis